jgi:hypothetical protein
VDKLGLCVICGVENVDGRQHTNSDPASFHSYTYTVDIVAITWNDSLEPGVSFDSIANDTLLLRYLQITIPAYRPAGHMKFA